MIIGLTGSIATGKSTVAKMLEKLNFPIVDADRVAREVVEPGKPALLQVIEQFGEDIVLEDGTLDRPKLGNIIFHNPEKRVVLNGIMHPAIRSEMLKQRDKWLSDGYSVVVMDIPLLFESKLQHFVEKIIVVSVSEETQLKRLMERNELSEEDARARMASQLPLSIKEQGADAVVYNDGSIGKTEQQLLDILKSWQVL